MIRIPRTAHPRLSLPVATLFVTLALATGPGVVADNHTDLPGYVDGSAFTSLVGDDAVTIELSLHGALLKTLVKIDDDLGEMAQGLESIHAVILTVEKQSTAEKVREVVSSTEKKLRSEGWQRLIAVREEDGFVHVLVLNDDERILGLVVLGLDSSDGSVIFTNIAGNLDLAAIAQIGEQFDLPGLEDIEDWDDD